MKKRSLITLAALLAFAGLGFSNTISFKLGYFVPNLKSDFWDVEFQNMSFMKSNFQEVNYGFSYEMYLTRELSLVFGLDTYNKNKAGYYRDYVGYQFDSGDFAFPSDYEGDYVPSHSLAVSITPIQVSLKVAPFGRRSKIIPYLGAGAGLYLWSLRMQGDMIDFSDEYIYDDSAGYEVAVYPIYPVDAMEGQNLGKVTLGFQVFGGVQIPVANRLTLDLEAKYSYAKGKFTEAFQGFQPLDLGGFHVSLGINYWF